MTPTTGPRDRRRCRGERRLLAAARSTRFNNPRACAPSCAPATTAEFNFVSLDRYLWNLQLGQAHVAFPRVRFYRRCRHRGYPRAGRSSGRAAARRRLPYVAFKPGTVDQIRKRHDAREADPRHRPNEDGWRPPPWDLRLRATYAQLRAQPNTSRPVGSIGTPDKLTSSPATGRLRYGRLPMPVDGVPVGTAAMI